jgi:hypothetical protein
MVRELVREHFNSEPNRQGFPRPENADAAAGLPAAPNSTERALRPRDD